MQEMNFVENPMMNEKVVKIVETLKDELISNFHPKSIILSGSFGRGEATVIEESGKPNFLSDCEITIIPYTYIFSRKKIDEFESNFYERTGLKVGIWGATLSFYLLVPFFNKKMKPTMENHDLKYGSKIIYGKDYLGRISDFKPEDIPIWEGIRLLFNRMAEALEHFSFENPSKEMVFWTDKIILACQDALLLSLGKYHHSYRKRNEMFQNLFSERFGGLEDELPNFLNLTIEATKRKLNGTMNVDDPIEYWFYTAKICNVVFKFTLKKDTGIIFDTYLDFQERYMEHLNIKKRFYHGSVSSMLYQNSTLLMKIILVFNNIISPKIITKVRIPWQHIIYSVIPLLYFGISRNGGINEFYLKRAREFLSCFEDLKEPKYNLSDEYRYVKKQVLDLWYCICC